MRATVLRALLLSAVLAGIFPFMYTVLASSSVEYKNPLHPATFHAMTYERQQQWLKENEIRISGFKHLSQRLGERHFWIEYAEFGSYMLVLLFVACVLMALWERSAMRSNALLNTDARQERPRAG